MISDLEIKRYDLLRFDRCRRRGGVVCLIKTLFHIINRKPNFCINTECISIEIFLPKSEPFLIGVLYRPPDKYDFVTCLERTFSDTNIIESQECYLLGDININLQPKGKEIFRNRSANAINKETPHLTRTYLELCCTYSLEQVNMMRFLFAQWKDIFEKSKRDRFPKLSDLYLCKWYLLRFYL